MLLHHRMHRLVKMFRKWRAYLSREDPIFPNLPIILPLECHVVGLGADTRAEQHM